jgi:phage major head subunit gpT-like protein
MMADVFNYSFTAGGGGLSSFTSGDALALFASNHTREDGGAAQSNYTTSDLNESSLEVATVAMRQTLDHKGQLYMSKADTLVVAPALEKEARILLNSTQRVGTANNDINPYQGALKLVVWDFLASAAGGSDTAWFLLDSSLHQLNFFNRSDRGLEGPEYDFDTKTAKWSVDVRHSVGFSGWRGTYGSKGDNS